jgi:hypothetical protein
MKNKECRWIGVLLLLVLVGCGDDKAPQTEFGSVKSVRAYREVVEDIIVEANAIEQDFRETAVGSTGQATGNNLSDAAMRWRPSTSWIGSRCRKNLWRHTPMYMRR